jgi:hypothetical protein
MPEEDLKEPLLPETVNLKEPQVPRETVDLIVTQEAKDNQNNEAAENVSKETYLLTYFINISNISVIILNIWFKVNVYHRMKKS